MSASSQQSASSAILTQSQASLHPALCARTLPRPRNLRQTFDQAGQTLERDPRYRSLLPTSLTDHPPVDPLTSQLLLIQLQQQRQILSMLEKQAHGDSTSPRHNMNTSPLRDASLPSPRSFLPFESSESAELTRPSVAAAVLNSAVVPIHAPPTRRSGRKSKKANTGVKVHKSNEAGMLLDPKGHPAMQSAASLQIAIRYCSQRAQRAAASEGALSYDKYAEFDKFIFPSSGDAITRTPAHSQPDFKIKDYCPAVFKELRSLFGVSEAEYLESLCQTDARNPSVPSLRVMGSPGKSGSMFFFSCDMRFIVKTIPKMECKQLRDLLPSSVPPPAARVLPCHLVCVQVPQPRDRVR
jgi:hypothetical protein